MRYQWGCIYHHHESITLTYSSSLLTPSSQDLSSSFVALESVIQRLWLSFQEIFLSFLVKVFKGGDLGLSKRDKLSLFISRDVGVFGSVDLNIVVDDGKNGVIFVFHDSLGKTDKSGFEHLFLDLFSVAFKLGIDFLGGIFDDSLKDSGSVDFFESLGLLKEHLSSVGDVSLEVLVFVGQESHDGFSLNIEEFLVELPEFKLVLGDSDQVSNLKFDVVIVVNIEVVTFVSRNSSIPSDQQRLEERFSEFEIEILKQEPEHEGEES